MIHIKAIPNKSGYFACSDGSILSKRHGFLKTFAAGRNKEYLYVDLSSKKVQAHIPIAQAFYGVPLFKKPQVDHLNGRKHDNRVKNLEWVTNAENQRRRYNHVEKELEI